MPFILLPPLALIPCTACGGEGYSEDERGTETCDTCGGSGEVEVCGVCLEAPQLVNGIETCACAATSSLPPIIQDRVPRQDEGEAA